MLFKSHGDVQSFSIGELFKAKDVAASLHRIEQPAALSMKPSDLYQQIKQIAEKRFRYSLPEKQSELKCLFT